MIHGQDTGWSIVTNLFCLKLFTDEAECGGKTESPVLVIRETFRVKPEDLDTSEHYCNMRKNAVIFNYFL